MAITTTLAPIDDGTNNSQVYLATNKTAISGSVSIGHSGNPSCTVDIKGAGSTSGTFNCQILNSSSAQILKIDDAGTIFIGSSGQAQFGSNGQLSMDIWKSKTSFGDDKLTWGTDELTLTFANNVYGWWNTAGLVISNANVGSAIQNTAVLELISTTKGFLPPKMTATQAEAIVNPAEGLMVYATNGSGSTITTKGWWGYDGSAWVKLN